jgi:hypothetical protein
MLRIGEAICRYADSPNGSRSLGTRNPAGLWRPNLEEDGGATPCIPGPSGRGTRLAPRCPTTAGRALDFDSGDLLREKAHLPLNEAAINPIMAHQVVRRPVLNDLSGVQYDNAVEISDCREPMRDRNYRPALHQSPECLLNRFLGFAIERGRRLIQQK